jgi:hypothetical protein
MKQILTIPFQTDYPPSRYMAFIGRMYMKIYHFLFIIIIFSLLSVRCNLNKNPISGYSNKYEGKWHWIRTVGGIFPRVITPEEGAITIIQYDNKNTFRLFRNDTLKVMAKYTIEQKDRDRDKISYSNIVTYDYNFYQDTEYLKVYGDTLDIWDGMIDGYFSLYLKELLVY